MVWSLLDNDYTNHRFKYIYLSIYPFNQSFSWLPLQLANDLAEMGSELHCQTLNMFILVKDLSLCIDVISIRPEIFLRPYKLHHFEFFGKRLAKHVPINKSANSFFGFAKSWHKIVYLSWQSFKEIDNAFFFFRIYVIRVPLMNILNNELVHFFFQELVARYQMR